MVYATSTLYPSDETLVLERPRRLQLALDLKPAPESAATMIAAAPSVLSPVVPSAPSRFATLLQWIQANLPWAMSVGILGAELAFHAPLAIVGAGMFGLTLTIVRSIIRRSPVLQKLLAAALLRMGLSKARMPVLAAGVGAGAWMSVALPSQALFFSAAEQYFQATFGGQSAAVTAIPLVFGVLRVIFVLYVAIALVRVINAFRNDEDWQTAARIPMMVVLCIVLGDVLSQMIVQ